jgi:hypothetical protein
MKCFFFKEVSKNVKSVFEKGNEEQKTGEEQPMET